MKNITYKIIIFLLIVGSIFLAMENSYLNNEIQKDLKNQDKKLIKDFNDLSVEFEKIQNQRDSLISQRNIWESEKKDLIQDNRELDSLFNNKSKSHEKKRNDINNGDVYNTAKFLSNH